MTTTKAINSKTNIKGSTGADLPFNPQQPVLNTYIGVTSAGQTSISLGFSIDTVNNPHALVLSINGKTLAYGSSNDYVFGAIDNTGLSSVVSLNAAVSGGLNIVAKKLGLRAEKELGIDSRFNQLYAMQQAGFQPFVDGVSNMIQPTTTVGTPAAGTFYSTVKNRAPITDMSQDLKARMGINRIMVQSAYVSQTEFGPNGEPVWLATNDQHGQIRIISNTNNPIVDGYGQRGIRLGNYTDYVEVTFYGTGLNILIVSDGNARTYQYSVDGGSFNTYLSTTLAAPMTNRNVNTNTLLPVVSGLSLGIHTVTLKNSAGLGLEAYGIEVLNESSSMLVNPGKSYVGGKALVNPSQASFAYNSMVTGTAGGRVLVYQKADGTIGSAFTATGSPAYMSAADHSQEEQVRPYYFREFGAGRTDDFSYAGFGPFNGSFTLDDGTTTLTAYQAQFNNSLQTVYSNGLNTFLIFTFVGTGVDIMRFDDANGSGSDAFTFYVDGVAVGSDITGINIPRQYKIASGLPYGTHTLRIQRTGGPVQWDLGIKGFIVYQPKTPSLPAGGVALASYNVLANYSFDSSKAASYSPPSKGLLRKTGQREFTYFGTWANNGYDPNFGAGFNISTSTSGSYFQYTFFGTGFEWRNDFAAGSTNIAITVDGNSNFSSYTTNFAMAGGTSGLSFNASTGVISGTSSAGAYGGITSISGLPIGMHTIAIQTNAANTIYADSIDVITPIHSHKSITPEQLQGVGTVGSQSIGDERLFSPVKSEAPKKNWSMAIGTIGSPTTTVNAMIPIPDMTCVIKTNGGDLRISYNASLYGNNNAAFYTQVFVDGSPVGVAKVGDGAVSGFWVPMNDSIRIPVSAGVHKVELMWQVNTNGFTVTNNGTERNLLVEEV